MEQNHLDVSGVASWWNRVDSSTKPYFLLLLRELEWQSLNSKQLKFLLIAIVSWFDLFIITFYSIAPNFTESFVSSFSAVVDKRLFFSFFLSQKKKHLLFNAVFSAVMFKLWSPWFVSGRECCYLFLYSSPSVVTIVVNHFLYWSSGSVVWLVLKCQPQR